MTIVSAALLARTAAESAIDNAISQPITPEVQNVLNRYVLNVVSNQPADPQTAHNNFLTTLRNDQTIPANVRAITELRLNRIFFLFNNLRGNRTAFDAGLQAKDNNISDFLETHQAQQLNQQYRVIAAGLRRLLPEDAFREVIAHGSGPIYSVP